MDGNYGAKSERPLSPEEREQTRRVLMDPLSFPEEFKFWLEHQIHQPAPQRRGRWKVFDTDVYFGLTGERWSGSAMGRGWSHDVPGVTKCVGGNKILRDGGHTYIDTWSNTFDDKDRQWRDTYSYEGATFSGWTRNAQIIRNRWNPGSFANANAFTVYLESRDGATVTKIADITEAPFVGTYDTFVNGYPVESTTPNAEGRVLILGSGSADGLFVYDPALGTTVLLGAYAAQLGGMIQRGNNNLLNQQGPITNRQRHNLGLIIMQEPENTGQDEILDYTGTSVFTMTAGGSGGSVYIAKFSPDGRWLAYESYVFAGGFHPELWLVDLTTMTETRLGAAGINFDFDLWDWSPNSDYIVHNDGNGDLFVTSVPDGYKQMIASAAGGYFYQCQWKGNTIVAEYDDPTFTLPRAYVEIAPKTGEWVNLDDHGTTTFGVQGYDVTGNNNAGVLSEDGKYLMYPKVNPAFADFAAGYYVNDVWVTETYGLAGS